MADVDTLPEERKPRKSVAFSDGAVMIDGDGEVRQVVNGAGERDTAEKHTAQENTDPAVDEAAAAFDDLALKKKKKSKKPALKDEEAVEDAEAPAVAEDVDFDAAALKKKKKKKVVKPADADDFEAKLAEAGAAEKEPEAGETDQPVVEVVGDMDEGTGIWAHDGTAPIGYPPLLERFYKLLNAHNPDLASGGLKNYRIPPPQCLREGNKKTIFANLPDIAKRMKRNDEHITQFLLAELGTTGSTDGNRRLVIKGKFLQKQIENVIRRYVMEYVTCKTCRSLDTELVRGENRLYFINCNSCGSRRSVTTIKTGFTAQVGKRKRPQG